MIRNIRSTGFGVKKTPRYGRKIRINIIKSAYINATPEQREQIKLNAEKGKVFTP